MARVASTLFLLAGFCLLSAASSQAEIYRCKGPDGKLVYSGNPAACPGQKPHELKGRFESVGSTAPPARALRRSRASPYGDRMEQAEESRWRIKKQQAEQRVEQSSYETEQLRRMVVWCNRGGDLYVTEESGLRKNVKCSTAKSEFAKATARKQQAEHYLKQGLEEECRRAGCLPGWLR